MKKNLFLLAALAAAVFTACGEKPAPEGPEKISVKPGVINVTGGEQSATFTVSGAAWEAVSDNKDFVLNPTSGDGKDNTVTVSFPYNTGSSTISVQITVTAKNNASDVHYVVLNQTGGYTVDPVEPDNPDGPDNPDNPQPVEPKVLAEWEFATEHLEFFEKHFAYELAKIDGKPNPDAHLPGYVSDEHYCESNIVSGGKIRFKNGSDKTALDDNGRCKRGTGNYGEPCWYGAWKGDVAEMTAETAEALPAGTKLHIFYALRPNTQNTLKYWLLEIKDGDNWVPVGEVKKAAAGGEEVSYNIELIYNPEGKGMDGENYPEVPQQINTFVDETYTLTSTVSGLVEYRMTCQSLMIADGSMVVSTIGETSASKAQNSVLRYAGKDSNSGGAHPVQEHMKIEIVK
ncbi:MAG: BACON domain-containing protein [Bacteroidales bacterium]|nr:BACON domain-containing protein [Bacteroidales bacterium]MBP5382028.1 BACON domain-containing protein [Bacteroidales bacterium]